MQVVQVLPQRLKSYQEQEKRKKEQKSNSKQEQGIGGINPAENFHGWFSGKYPPKIRPAGQNTNPAGNYMIWFGRLKTVVN
jgi:hypothetical protein